MKLYGVFILDDAKHIMCVDAKSQSNDKPCLYTDKEAADKYCAYLQSLWVENTYKVIEWDVSEVVETTFVEFK